MADDPTRTHKFTDMYWARIAVLVLALIWCGVGGGLAVGAFVDLKNKVNAAKSSVDPATVAFVNALNVNNLYIPGLLSAVPALLLAFTALCSLLAMGWAYYRRRGDNDKDTIAGEGVIMLLLMVWLFIAIIIETVYFATKLPANVTIVINGYVAKPFHQFGLARSAIIVLWFAWLFATVCLVTLFVASSEGTTKRKPLTPAEIEEMRRRDRQNPGYEHLTRPLDPDEKKAVGGATRPGASPATGSGVVDPSGGNVGVGEKPQEMGSTSGSNAV